MPRSEWFLKVMHTKCLRWNSKHPWRIFMVVIHEVKKCITTYAKWDFSLPRERWGRYVLISHPVNRALKYSFYLQFALYQAMRDPTEVVIIGTNLTVYWTLGMHILLSCKLFMHIHVHLILNKTINTLWRGVLPMLHYFKQS